MRHPFLRTLAGATAAAPTDPNFKNVTLLLHGDGTNGGQNNTFVDGSTNNFTVTRNGNTTQGTFSPYGSNWSNYFDGTGDYLSIGANAAFDFGTGNFTIEAWVYISGNSALDGNGNRPGVIFAVADSVYSASFIIDGNPSTTGTGLILYGPAYSSVAGTITQNTWNHLAVSKSGTSVYFWLNGTQLGTTQTTSGSWGSSTKQAQIGQSLPGLYTFPLNGYISNLRVLKGTALYTSAFTPPSAPLTAITNTVLLTCQSNRFRDASTNNFTLTRNGDVSVQRFFPFSPTAAYAAGTIGGSGYFDGTGDYLSLADNAALEPGASDLTWEAWINTTLNRKDAMLYARGTSYGAGIWLFLINSASSTAGDVALWLGDYSASVPLLVTSGVSVRDGAWHHLALVRNGSSWAIYIDGVSRATATWSGTISDIAVGATIARDAMVPTTRDYQGYISNLRIIKGTAAYTSNFTPPTSPLTAITNTSLLLNFTNAAVLDNAMMAVPETVGNAQIDTTTKKYGTGSMKFDGTGDYLRSRNNPDLAFGTGNFTIEAWVYIAGNSSPNAGGNRDAAVLSSLGSGTLTGYEFKISGDTTTTGIGLTLTTFISGTSYSVFGASTISPSTWHHIAVVRSGTTTTLYLNGTSIGSGTLGNQTINSIYDLWVGGNDLASYPHFLNGYIDDLRITKGVARYTANFTPPTAAFPDL